MTVAVVGAGIMGAATAYALAGDGQDVTLYEQFEVGHTRGSSQRPSPCSRMQPVPTVPEPRTSPAQSSVFRAACATSASQE